MTSDARLLSFVERLERLQSEKDAIAADMKEVRKECKSAGYDLPALARLLKRRQLDREEQQERDAIDETYQRAVGMLAGTPLAEASRPKASTTSQRGGDPSAGGEKPEEGDGWGEDDSQSKVPVHRVSTSPLSETDEEPDDLRDSIINEFRAVPGLLAEPDDGQLIDPRAKPDILKSVGTTTDKVNASLDRMKESMRGQTAAGAA